MCFVVFSSTGFPVHRSPPRLYPPRRCRHKAVRPNRWFFNTPGIEQFNSGVANRIAGGTDSSTEIRVDVVHARVQTAFLIANINLNMLEPRRGRGLAMASEPEPVHPLDTTNYDDRASPLSFVGGVIVRSSSLRSTKGCSGRFSHLPGAGTNGCELGCSQGRPAMGRFMQVLPAMAVTVIRLCMTRRQIASRISEI